MSTLPSLRAPVLLRRRSRASRGTTRRAWTLAVGAVAALVATPVLVVATSLLRPSVDVWRLLWETSLVEMVVATATLMVGTVCGCLLLGGGLGWLLATHRFPGHGAFSWLVVLPLAMPTYVLGFVAVGMLDAPGPVQQALRSLTGADGRLFDPRSMVTAIVVFSLALYPYVYLQARAAFAEQGATTYDAARTLGLRPAAAVRRVVLPLARPALAAGAALVAMETLTDFATVQYFNVETVSVGIERVWYGMYDRGAATELASMVLLLAVGILAGERLLRGRARYDQRGGRGAGLAPVRLHGRAAVGAVAACVGVLVVAVGIPLAQLLVWADPAGLTTAGGGLDGRYLAYLGNSVLVAAVAAVACVAVGLLVVNAVRLTGDRATRRLAGLAAVGYALPGPVVAIGTLLALAGLGGVLDVLGVPGARLLAIGSVWSVIAAYVVRFLALSTQTLDASLERISPATTMSALTLGASPRRVVGRIHLPQLTSGIGVGLVLVAIDALKELPIVLLLRPFGFETLSLWVFRSAAEARWELAGIPALTIVAVAAIPVVTLFRATLRDPADARGRVRRPVTDPEPLSW